MELQERNPAAPKAEKNADETSTWKKISRSKFYFETSASERAEIYKTFTELGQHFCVEISPSSRSMCRGCRGVVKKGDIRFRHVVCSSKCFNEKKTGQKVCVYLVW